MKVQYRKWGRICEDNRKNWSKERGTGVTREGKDPKIETSKTLFHILQVGFHIL